jgi:hypothetical protein
MSFMFIDKRNMMWAEIPEMFSGGGYLQMGRIYAHSIFASVMKMFVGGQLANHQLIPNSIGINSFSFIPKRARTSFVDRGCEIPTASGQFHYFGHEPLNRTFLQHEALYVTTYPNGGEKCSKYCSC